MSPGELLSRNVERFRGGRVFKAHRLFYRSTLRSRVIKKKKKQSSSAGAGRAPQRHALDHGPWTLDPGPSTPDLGPCNPALGPQTLDLRHETPDLVPLTLNVSSLRRGVWVSRLEGHLLQLAEGAGFRPADSVSHAASVMKWVVTRIYPGYLPPATSYR